MREFRDDQGRPWQVALTIAAAMRVRDNVTIDVEGQKVPFDIVDVSSIATTMQVLRGQYTTIAETLYAILCRQVEEKKLSKEEFFDGLRGDALDSAAKVLELELIDFFPPRLRKMIGLLAAKMDEATAELMTRAEASMQAATTGEILSGSGLQSGRPQESSESFQASGLSDNSLQPATAA
ncbi:MAG: hypothetical protein EBR82_25185 [Caulobacteraceae bacterium]|nr:hypothetical protein [Caulobacteraceae bacterium]